ncbi:MAG: hypothetical protein AAGF68_04300, partial [Pseudomonadota bacterium]
MTAFALPLSPAFVQDQHVGTALTYTPLRRRPHNQRSGEEEVQHDQKNEQEFQSQGSDDLDGCEKLGARLAV